MNADSYGLKLNEQSSEQTVYDYNMLMNCSYPWDLKARVKGRNGHLSNNDAAKFIREMYTNKLQKIFLAHDKLIMKSYLIIDLMKLI